MSISNHIKRLFFGFSLTAPWEELSPPARLLKEEDRHLTIYFLGNVPLFSLEGLPFPSFSIGAVGIFDHLLFLPPHYPNVVSYHAEFFNQLSIIKSYKTELETFLMEHQIIKHHENREWLPHATIGRGPTHLEEWEKWFSPLPFYMDGFHLYESLGNSEYKKIWGRSFIPPFKALDHTADFGFHLIGSSISELFLHAQIAICFLFPELSPFITNSDIVDITTMIKRLNGWISFIDIEIGAPIKAISYHGTITKENDLYHWEMILDV